jgi:glutamine synthetase
VDWHEEAKKRGLLNLPTTLDALERFDSEKNVNLFERYDVLNERELLSRHDIFVEQYFLTINIEAETTEAIARTMILPAAVRYLRELSSSVNEAAQLGIEARGVRETAEELNARIDTLRDAIKELITQNKELGGDDVHSKAIHMRDNVIPAMNAVRQAADRLERAVPNEYWPLPTYREILFVK